MDGSEDFGFYPEEDGSYGGFWVEEGHALNQVFTVSLWPEEQREQSRNWGMREEARALVQVGNDGSYDQVCAMQLFLHWFLKAKQTDVAYGFDVGDLQGSGVKDTSGILTWVA